MENATIGLAFLAGLLSFISPCVLPLVPAYIGYMGGRMSQSLITPDGKTKNLSAPSAATRANLLLHGLVFVAGFSTVFVTLGLATTAFLQVVGSAAVTLEGILGRLGGLLIIFFGLHFMGVLNRVFNFLRKSPFIENPMLTVVIVGGLGAALWWGFDGTTLALAPMALLVFGLLLGGAFNAPGSFWRSAFDKIDALMYSDTRADMSSKRSTGLGGSFTMGVIFSAGWTPCIGPMYGTILAVAATQGETASGLLLLLAYSFGLGLPFILAALLLDKMQGILRRLQRSMRAIKFFSGALLVFVGVLVAQGELAAISQRLSTQFADFSIRVEQCGVGYFAGELQLAQVGSCLNGTLIPMALDQGGEGAINADVSRMEFVFHVKQSLAIDVEISRIVDPAGLHVTLVDGAGSTIAESSTFSAIDTKKHVAIANITLEPGMYTVIVTANTPGDYKFRAKVRAAQPLQQAPDVVQIPAADNTNSIAEELAAQGLNTIDEAPLNTIETNPDGEAEGVVSQPAQGLKVGSVAPDFTVTLLDGTALRLEDLRGKVVILNFWGTWCGPCRREMPDLQLYHEQYGADGLVIVGLAVRDTEAAVKAFREEFGLTFKLALDTGNQINDQYAVPGQPSTFILDKNGVIVFRHFSVITEDQVVPVLEKALAE